MSIEEQLLEVKQQLDKEIKEEIEHRLLRARSDGIMIGICLGWMFGVLAVFLGS